MAADNLHTTADTPDQIADMFNNYFTSVFSSCQSEKEKSGPEQRPTIQPVIYDIVLYVSEVEAVLKSLDPNKSPQTLRLKPHQGAIRRTDCGLSAWVSVWAIMRH